MAPAQASTPRIEAVPTPVAASAPKSSRLHFSMADKKTGRLVQTVATFTIPPSSFDQAMIAAGAKIAATPPQIGDAFDLEVHIPSVEMRLDVASARDAAMPDDIPVPGRRPANKAVDAIAAITNRERDRDETESRPVAFARPENPVRSRTVSPSLSEPKTAVYDVTNAVVHMPDGSQLEAHSGIGGMRDNPKFFHVKMTGPTPPGFYRLSMREALFHGVAAMRLTPVDGKNPLNRDGLLAHSYLLRRPGDSHGCVVFADYKRFLKAFRDGKITHIRIVAGNGVTLASN